MRVYKKKRGQGICKYCGKYADVANYTDQYILHTEGVCEGELKEAFYGMLSDEFLFCSKDCWAIHWLRAGYQSYYYHLKSVVIIDNVTKG